MAKKESSKSRVKENDDQQQVDFEVSLAEVEQVLARLESGELGLTESLEQYETGIKQLKRCLALLDAAEQRVTLLSGFDRDGNPVQQPIDDLEAASGGREQLTRSPPRSAAAANKKKGSNDARSGLDTSGQSVDDFPDLF